MTVSQQQVDRFFADGFLIVEDLFTEAELNPVLEEIGELVDDLARRLHAAGLIADRHEELDVFHRLTALERDFKGAAVLIHTRGRLGPRLAELWSSPKLLDIVERFIGPDIAGHPVWNIRSKTPSNRLMTVPWHQDTAYLAPGAEHTLQPTAWIPFLDANKVNGCIQVIRGGHRSGTVFPHRLERTVGDPDSWYLYIDERDLPPGEVVTCEMRLGSVLFLSQLTPHRSLENHSDRIRWSVDLRWQDPKLATGDQSGAGVFVMRRGDDPGFRPDWSEWMAKQRAGYERQRGLAQEQFSTKVSGLWMDRWRSVA